MPHLPDATHESPIAWHVPWQVFAGVKPDMKVWREEIFGPVLSVMTFKTEAEALHLANDCEFGLGASCCAAAQCTCCLELSQGLLHVIVQGIMCPCCIVRHNANMYQQGPYHGPLALAWHAILNCGHQTRA